MQKTSVIGLNEGERNVEYIVDFVDCKNIPVSRRLTELGFVQEARLKIIQFSALKKTLLVEIEGYTLSLRSNIAAIIKVKK